MDGSDFDQLLHSYRQAVDAWVGAIRAEESLATEDHSMVQMEKWDDAGFNLQRCRDHGQEGTRRIQECLAEKELRVLRHRLFRKTSTESHGDLRAITSPAVPNRLPPGHSNHGMILL